jgi:hypothetical protein
LPAARAARRGLALVLVISGLVASSSTAEAQGWLDDRQRAEGPGFRVGNLELHPGIGFEAGYDSNVFLQETGERGSGILRTTAHLMLSTLGPERREEGEADAAPTRDRQMVDFRGGINASHYHYFESRAQDNVGGDLSLDLTLNPNGPFTFRVHETLGRRVRPFAPDAATTRPIRWGRNQNVAGVELGLRSRSSILRGTVGYSLAYDAFDDPIFRYANSLTHHSYTRASWNFLPSTALVHEFDVHVQRLHLWDPSAPTLLSDNIRLSTRVGINGAVTQRFSVAALVGYAAGFYENPLVNDFDSPIGRLEARWTPRPTVQTMVGYERRFTPSFIGNYRQSDRIYARAQIIMLGALLIGPEAVLSWDVTDIALTSTAGDVEFLGNRPRRESTRVRLSLFTEYRVTNWLAINATAGFLADYTDYRFNEPDPAVGVLPDPGAQFQRFEVFAGVRAFY